MKKTFAIILIALMAMTAVFADALTSTHVDPITVIPSESANANLEVSLKIDPADMYFYAFGFTTDHTGAGLSGSDREVPSEYAGTLALAYDPVTSTASDSSMYFYYKARTNAQFCLEFAMTDLSGNNTTVGWDATFEETLKDGLGKGDADLSKGKAIKSVASKNAEITDNKYKATINAATSTTGYFYGLYHITLKTDQIPMVDGVKNVAGTLSVTISAS